MFNKIVCGLIGAIAGGTAVYLYEEYKFEHSYIEDDNYEQTTYIPYTVENYDNFDNSMDEENKKEAIPEWTNKPDIVIGTNLAKEVVERYDPDFLIWSADESEEYKKYRKENEQSIISENLLTYFAEDHVVIDEEDEHIVDINSTIGPYALGVFDNQNSYIKKDIYVAHIDSESDDISLYVIQYDEGSYAAYIGEE